MYKISIINADVVTTYAAEELKKYLRMMMPRCGEITIRYDCCAGDGFRLGLMRDFGLDPQVDDASLDDVIYVDTDENGGIIAGSNYRSVLLAVYRYLKANGCCWLFPGPDGEYIPVRQIAPVKLSIKASCRYRGLCNEGSETQPIMYDVIDFMPKIGLNAFMIEFDIPKVYYQRGYDHKCDPYYEPEQPLSPETVLQWKRACESELSRRGLQFHDMGHGWTAEPFGFDSSDGWRSKDVKPSADKAKHIAQVGGIREFNGGVALNTNLCMSDAETRRVVTEYVVNYAEKQNNVDFLHVWLADGSNNHCECPACTKKRPSDWYVMLLNEIDEALCAKGLNTHIAFIAYVDTLWAPIEERIKNQKRFTMLFAPITRKYTETYQSAAPSAALPPFLLNRLKLPRGMGENLALLEEWKKMWKGDVICYEYHFHMCQYYDLGGIYLARLVYDDVHGLKQNGLSGIIEDGSQHSFFPTGLAFYVYAEAMFDLRKSFEELVSEYFFAAFGTDWRVAFEYLSKISENTEFGFVAGEESVDRFDPEKAGSFEKIASIIKEYAPVIEAHTAADNRTQYVHWDALRWHEKYAGIYAEGLIRRCRGEKEEASGLFVKLCKELAPFSHLRPTMIDHRHMTIAARRVLSPQKEYSEILIEE